MPRSVRGTVFLCVLGGALCVGAPPPAAADELTEILREKGVITKEDWIRVKAAEEKQAEEIEKRREEEFPVEVGWGKKGFTLSTKDGKWKTAIQWRLQSRWTYPERNDADSLGDFTDSEESTFELRRARMKVGGHGYQPWIKYYFEVDWQPTADPGDPADGDRGDRTRLIDWRIMLEKYKWMQLRVGQWKINLNRERVDSSGKQQFVERSIVNSPFTIDRQVGAMVYGHVFPGTFADGWYYAGVFTGNGRATKNDDDNMMWMGRLQWNFFGRDLKFSQSDVEYHEKPAASIAFAGATNIGVCTRWSSSGCGNLPGLTAPNMASDGQFRTDNLVEEFALKYRGLSIQHEYHWKQVKDSTIAEGAPGRQRNLMGAYQQIGYFPHYLVPAFPKPLEVALRYAFVDPNVAVSDDLLQEFTVAMNWFFAGHRNKLTLDGSWLTLEDPAVPNVLNEQRVRLQWDVSF